MRVFQWPIEHLAALDQYYTEAGLEDVKVDLIRPPPSIFRAFYEHWFALNVQLVPVLEARDPEAAQEATKLLTQMRKDAQEHGVFSAHIVKTVIGRKPSGAAVNGTNGLNGGH